MIAYDPEMVMQPVHSLFGPVRGRGAADDLAHQVLDAIRAGELQVGDSLPSERSLARAAQVSRPTVRLALTRLGEAGLIRSGTGRNGVPVIVSIWIPAALERAASAPPDLGTVLTVLEARRTIEPRLAQLAAARATDEQLARMQETIDLMRSHVDDRPRVAQAEAMFHRMLWRAADNRSLERMMLGLFRDLAVLFDMTLRTHDDRVAAIAFHERTLAALRTGDAVAIAAIMDDHLGSLEQIVGDVLLATTTTEGSP